MGTQADRGFVVAAVNIKHVQCRCSWGSCVCTCICICISAVFAFCARSTVQSAPCCHSVAWRSAREMYEFWGFEIWSSCLNTLHGNCCCMCVCDCVCVLWLSVCACVSVHVCGVCCHHLGCVVVDSRLHTPGKSVITQAKAHTHCELVHSVVALPPPFPSPPPLSLALSLCPLFSLSVSHPNSSSATPHCGPTSGLAMTSVSCVLECVGASGCFTLMLSLLASLGTHTHAHTHARIHAHTYAQRYS